MSNPATPGTNTAPRDPKKVLASVFGDKFAKDYQGSFIVIPDFVVRSATAKRFFEKDFAYLSRQMYYEYQYRNWHGFSKEILDRYATVINTKLANIQVAQSNWLARLKKILEQNGKAGEDASALYPGIAKHHVPVIAQQSRIYLEALQQLDEVYTLASSAYLWGIIDAEQRSQQEWFAKKAVRAFRAVLQLEAPKLYREARRLQEDHRGQGAENPQMAGVIDQQQKDIKNFDAAAAEDDKSDGSTPLADPAAALSEMAKVAAASGGAKKIKTRKGPTEPSGGPEAGVVPVPAAPAAPAAEAAST